MRNDLKRFYVKKKDIIELDITQNISLEKSMGEYDGKKVLVKGGFKGQRAEVFIKKVRKNRAEGIINKIIEKADYEITPICEKFGECGGCSFQNLSYDKQLELKEEYVRNLFEKAQIKYDKFNKILPSPLEIEYRNKMEFSFGDKVKDGPLTLGMHEKGKHHNIVSTENCKLVDEDYRKILNTVLKYFLNNNKKHYNKYTKDGFLRHLVIRKGMYTNEILVNLVTTTKDSIKESEFVKLLTDVKLSGKIVSILHTKNDSFSDAVIAQEVVLLYGKEYIMEECLNLKFKISPFSFFQTNTKGAEVLYSLVRDLIGDDKSDVIFDLYCGTGTITQLLSKKAKHVYGIEIVEEAVEAARENTKLNGIDNCTFICGDVLEQVDNLSFSPDIIVLDPPRVGINPKAIGKIIEFNPKKFIYISCKATSLIHDLPSFIDAGYNIDSVTPVDMFPMTGHVETIVLIQKKNS